MPRAVAGLVLWAFADTLQVTEENSKLIATVKACLCGEGDVDSTPETITAVANEVYNQDLLSQLVTNLPRLEFEVSVAG